MPGKSVQVGPFVGGLNTFSDPSSIADNELAQCENFELDLDGSLRSRPPFSDYGIDFPLGVSGNMQLLGYYYTGTGGAHLIASDGMTSTYYFDGTSWGLITNTFAASSMAQYNDDAYLLAPPGASGPGGIWDGGVFTAAAEMPHGDVIVVYKDRMWIAMGKDAAAHGNRMFWSNTLVDTELWPTTPNFVDIGSGDGQNIVALIVQYNTLLIFRSHSVWSFQYTADPKQAAQFLVVPGVGLANKNSVVQFESYIYWMYEDRAYQYINNRALQLNMKVLFRSTASVSDYYLPFAVSEFNRRIIFSYYDTMFVFSLKTRTWTTWKSDTYGGLGKIIKKDNEPNIQAVAHSSKLVPLTASRKAKTLLIKDELSTELETFTCRVTTKNYDYQVSSAYKRLFWWGADASFGGSVTGRAVPISYNFSVTWGNLLSRATTWGQLLSYTWAKPSSDSLTIESIRSTSGTTNSRKFIKFPQGLRFRQINYQLEFVSDGTASTAVRLFSLTTFIKPKEHVSTAVS